MSELILSGEEAVKIIDKCHDDFEQVEDSIVDHRRWTVVHKAIFKHKPTGKFYSVNYDCPATEIQDNEPFWDADKVAFQEVTPMTNTVVVYV